MIELIFATGNQAKLAQLAFVIENLNAPITLVSAQERFGSRACYEERGNTAAAIAANGAQTLAVQLGVPIVTEDTAFYVDALGGEPGVQAGTYLRQYGRAGILHRLKHVPNRRATIVSAVAWASPDGDTQTWQTAVNGRIALQERWTAGLPNWVAPSPAEPLGGGYNAIFIPDGSLLTLAEIPPEQALEIGYREPNFCALVTFLLKHAGRQGV